MINKSMRAYDKTVVGKIETGVLNAFHHFGTRIQSIYLVGSLTYGGYIPNWSDIDLDVVLRSPIQPEEDLLELGQRIQRSLRAEGHQDIYTKCHTVDQLNSRNNSQQFLGDLVHVLMMIDHGMLIYGVDCRANLVRPSLNQIRNEIRDVCYRLSTKPDEWWSNLQPNELSTLLSLPGRMLATWETGTIVGKENGLMLFLERHKENLSSMQWLWLNWALVARCIPSQRIIPNLARVEAGIVVKQLISITFEKWFK